MEQKLRKVEFALNERNSAIGDLSYENKEGVLKTRNSFFHRFGDFVHYDSGSGRERQKTMAIIEVNKTGKIYKVAVNHIQFEDAIMD